MTAGTTPYYSRTRFTLPAISQEAFEIAYVEAQAVRKNVVSPNCNYRPSLLRSPRQIFHGDKSGSASIQSSRTFSPVEGLELTPQDSL